MSLTMNLLFMICCLASIYNSNGCQMEGVTVWQLPITVQIEDYHEGVILQRGITNIIGFSVTSYADLNGGPYVDVSIADSLFVLRTNAAYREYEEKETSQEMSLTFTFNCAGGTTSLPLTVRIVINDNNNNDPLFKTEDATASADTTYDFTIAPPVPPGFLITDCVRDIIVRDIDLTTYRIDFGIEDNPYIEIEYDESASSVPKEFKAILRTTTFIRSLPEAIVLRISATDVDLTGDDPITTYTTVTIHGSSEFELPTEPVFSEPLYLANYLENGHVTLEQTIFLQQGYDDQVEFSLEGDYAENHFNITVDGNRVSLVLTSPLPAEVFRQGQIFLVVRATRAYTSGAAATIVVLLPEAVNLQFQQPHYKGEIVDNTLQLTQLILSQGHQESSVTITIEDYPSFFTASVVGNLITLSMTPLDSNIIEQNNFISLRVTASTEYSSATTIVTLEIVKDDTVTPVFEKPLYDGTYDTTLGLTLEPLILIQGYDDSVQITLSGEHDSYFELVRDGASSTLRAVGSLPPQVLSNTHLLLSVEAAKPRTVAASAVVSITLPAARELQFEAPTYRGSIENNTLTIETIILSVGYDEDVTFSISGDYSSSFILTNVENQVWIHIATPLPPDVLAQNDVVLLTITAARHNALSTSAAVLLDIIKDDITTPVFNQPIYFGNYLASHGIDMPDITLVQGYDNSVVFRIEGENSQYFQINQNAENSLTLTVRSSIPEEVVFYEKVFVFNIIANKPLTVGANAAIAIKFSEEFTEPTLMQFAKKTYTGSLDENILTLENIVLETGFAASTEFHLTGDYASYFTTAVTNNLITLSLPNGLSTDILDNNKFIVLELEARRERAVSVFTSVVIDLVEAVVVTPVFTQAYYTGKYSNENVLQFEETMTLQQGYDETVTFGLEGESSVWFTVVQNGNTASLIASLDVPQDVLDSNHQLLFNVVANKPNAISGRSAISIDLPKDILSPEVLLFEQISYEGQIDGNNLQIPSISLMNEITDNLAVELRGDHAAYFSVSHNLNTVHVDLLDDLPPELLSNNEFLVIGIMASKPNTFSGYTTLILTIVKQSQILPPIFEQAFYTGELSEQDGLLFEHTIRLMQGFDDSVSFTVDGDHAQWFTLVAEGNSVTLVLSSAIPPAVIANNQQLVFVVTAHKQNSNTARATVVISLADDFTDAIVLGFERASYLGTIENDVAIVEPIVLNEGFSPAVTFTLHGDLASYFVLAVQGSSVSVVLQSAIPEQSVPANNIILLELHAAAPQAVPAITTVVFEVVREQVITAEELAFGAPYYTGQFSVAGGLVFETAMSLSEGYDQNVQFALEGEHSQWFTLVAEGNYVTLVLSSAIPPAVIANNQQLVFVVTALKQNSNTARATVVISLVDDFTDANVLGFERVSYLGTIENDVAIIEPIVLNEGFSPAVTFTLHGDLASYFALAVQGSSVSVVLQSAIPEQSVPANNIILLELHAAAPQAVPAITAVVFEVVREEVITAEELAFGAPYYTGQFSVAGGLVFETAMSLSEGYDQNVQFALEGEHSQWFTLVAEGNYVTLVLSSAIPPAVIANNQQLVFVVTALKQNSNTARATVVISLVDDFTDANVLGFERVSYLGTIENDVAIIEPIVLNEGFSPAVTFTLHGDLASYFALAVQGSSVSVVLQSAIPEQSVPANNIILLELHAAAPQAVPAITAVVFEVVREEVITAEELAFGAPYYTGQFSVAGGLVFETAMSLSEGYDQNVQFALEGEHSQWFTLVAEGNYVTLVLSSAIPPAVIANNQQLVFVVTALKQNSNTARATVVISLVEDFTDANVLGFERVSYLGTIENDVAIIEPIVLNEGFTPAVTFTLHGDLASYFVLVVQGSSVSVVLQSAIPEQSVPANNIILLELHAAAPQAVPAVTAVVFEVVREQVITAEELAFGAPYYTGQFSVAGGLVFETAMSLSEGYDQNVQFALEGEHSQWFTLVAEGNYVTLVLSSAIPPAVIANNQQLVFVVTALKQNSNTARATVVISLVDDFTDANVLGFERVSYLGTIENDVAIIEPIVLNEGFTPAVTFTLHGDLASYFVLVVQGSSVSVVLQSAIPEQSVPANNIILLELHAAAPQTVPAVTAVVFEVVREQVITAEELAFGAPYYTGQFSVAGGLVFETAMSLSEGYEQNVQFALQGEHAQWFTLVAEGNSVTLVLSGAIPPAVTVNNQQLLFVVTALKPNSNTARATVVISLVDGSGSVMDVAFEKVLYQGIISLEVVQHETISITGYDGDVVEIFGDYRDLFSASASEGTVTVAAAGSLSLPQDVTYVPLELRAGGASAVLLLRVTQAETPELPSVTFGAPSYVLRVDMTHTGLVGRVSATASNGEIVTYSLAADNAHLQERVSVNGDGEIHLSAPTNTGVYSFQVIATSVITQVQATATVHLTVDATSICGKDDHVLPPLIILDRDEEESHENLVVLDNVTLPGCQFRLSNRWPLEHDWLYVDENGLHARSIDREDSRIAFMGLSQVQVELVLECPSESQTRAKRSKNTSSRLDWLGPYDYGSNKWILTDTILHDSRRSYVNLIVNDINDNSPIFIGKENEPIVVGYPIRELEEIVLPRALAELKATDADVGVNAALRYWSEEAALAVAPATGAVHVRDGAALADGVLLVAAATDRNGQGGHTGTIQLLVKLLDVRHIAVVTVRNAFLDQEEDILRNIAAAVGYEVKVLSSAVISDDTHVDSDSSNTRNKREVISAEGASLQLYVYGIIDREPVAVGTLSTDIAENVLTGIDIARTISLEDHLEGREIPSGRDTALLVSTIVLSVLLFILIVIIAVWFFLRWKKARNYEQFSDANSLASRNEPLELPLKVDSLKKPRLNLEELKKSERRLQEMLDAPVNEVPAKPSASTVDPKETFDTIVSMSPPETTMPIVIQSIDRLKDDADSGDEDEFGERNNKMRKKSVVTFNENVEKIIHVEDIPDDNSDIEVFRL